MTKGFLVIIMVIYHTLNYSTQYYLAFRYISFLPPSFIFITGFLISAIYPNRYSSNDTKLYRRLFIRGLKLVVLFTLLNLAVRTLFGLAAHDLGRSLGEFFSRWTDVYLVGSGRTAIFEVLLPIGYFLLLSPLLLGLQRRHNGLLVLATASLIGLCLLLQNLGIPCDNLNLVTVGALGMLCGLLPVAHERTLSRKSVWIGTLIAYALYFPLGVSQGYVYLVQLLGALTAVALLLTSSTAVGEGGWLRNRIIRLGQYSLVAYIVQIAILQVVLRIVGRQDPLSLELLAVFMVTLIVMTLLIEATHALRRRMPPFETLYRVFFA